MILGYGKSIIFIVDHRACYNCNPLVYVAPVAADLEEAIALLDVQITSDYRDGYTKNSQIGSSCVRTSHGALGTSQSGSGKLRIGISLVTEQACAE